MNEAFPVLALDARSGLPDTLAYLRANYPQADWRKHRNFGELSDYWLQTHDRLRRGGRELVQATAAFREGRWDPADFQRFFVPRINQFLGHLDRHHRIEDVHYFPRFRALDHRMVAGFDLLEADHDYIHEALLRSARSGQHFLTALGRSQDNARQAADDYALDADSLLRLLLRHLADEEDLIVPAMLHHGERSLS